MHRFGTGKKDSKQHVADELEYVRWEVAVFPHQDHEFTRKAVRPLDPNQVLLSRVQAERSNRHAPYSHAERHQVDDEIEAIERHAGFHDDSFSAEPLRTGAR
jgi:hypothetical protein